LVRAIARLDLTKALALIEATYFLTGEDAIAALRILQSRLAQSTD
jgi:hypothetical protein